MFYSNPNIYTDSKHAENKSWTLKEDDNMPICQASSSVDSSLNPLD